MDLEDLGETSKKKSTDIYDNDRPLKKARYVWQVKGKYHLKENHVKLINTDTAVIGDDKLSLNDEIESKLVDVNLVENDIPAVLHINNNVAQARNKNFCSDRSCIEELIANSDKIMDYPDPESPPKNIDKSISDEIPITLVKPNPENEDYFLRKWQARQIAKGFVDNTINRVLESWMIAPFDAADFVENCDNGCDGGQVEDEGILMAIQSHGLQSGVRDLNQRMNNDDCTQGSSRLFSSRSNISTNNIGWDSINSCTCIKPRNELTQNQLMPPFHHRSDDNDVTLEYYENVCILKDAEPIQRNFFVYPTKSSTEEFKSTIKSETIPDLIEQTSDTTNETSNINNYDCLKMDDTDFLDAAVAVAIQKKGLTSYNCVDCG